MKTTRTLAFTLIAATATWQGLLAQTTAPATPPAKPEEDEVFELSPFEVTAEEDSGYVATSTLAGTRIRTDLRDVGSAISVITKEFMQDIGATDSGSLLQYTANAEVAGTLGTYAGLGNGSSVDEGVNLRSPSRASRVRGLAQPDNTRDFFITDIPWNSFNTDRIDIQRGANSILFGLGSAAGIINQSTRNPEFRTSGSVEIRTGSYGSVTNSVDLNQELIDDVLAVRIDGLWDDQKFRQKPAYQEDKRLYGAIRFAPKLFKDRTWRTSLKIKYERGNIDSNRPRDITPNDSISPWFRPKAASATSWTMANGMGMTPVDNGYDANRSNIQEILDGNAAGLNKGLQANNAQNPNYQPWLATTGINQQQPFYTQEGATGQTIMAMGGYINPGARTATGAFRNASDGLAGKFYADQFFGLTNMPTFAANARIPFAGSGQYRNTSLQDPTIFDFYTNLIDGTNKWEKQEWDAYNIDLSQTAFGDRLGVQFIYDRQQFSRSNEAELGTAPTITIDILKNFADFWRTGASGTTVTNPNYGRPYVAVNSGGVGNSYHSDRDYVRGSVFGEVRANDFFDRESLLARILGKHRFNGVYSREKFFSETRGWNRVAVPLDWSAYWNGNTGTGTSQFDRPLTQVVYLGGSLANATSAAGANIPRVLGELDTPDTNLTVFDSTWTNFGVGFGDPWTVPSTLSKLYNTAAGTVHTQNENPANYRGWTFYPLNLVRYDNGANESLTTSAAKALRQTTSYAGSWQAFLWNDSIVATAGWRYDEVRGKDASAQPTLARAIYNLNPAVYKLPDEFPTAQTFKDHSTSGGVVVHLNKVLGDRDVLPINVSLSYNKSNNFQVTNTRRDVYGKILGNPTGSTKDYGISLSTKDGKYNFRAIKYETAVKNDSGGIDPGAVGGFIAAGLRWRNVYLYKLSVYEWNTREQPRSRNTWGGAANSLDALPGGQGSPADTSLTSAEGRAREDAAIRGWNEIQAFAQSAGLLDAWGLTNMIPLSVLTDRTTYENAKSSPTALDPAAQYLPPDTTSSFPMVRNYSATRPQGLAATSDTFSEGYEFELTANPLPNWRLAFNASKTEATRTNVGGESFKELIAFMDSKVLNADGTPNFVGQIPQFGNLGLNWYNNAYAQFRGQYEQMKLQEGTAAPEIRKWRYNVVTNYTFTEGRLKGVGVGGGYRWEDKVVIGYPVTPDGGGFTFDLSRPYYGPAEDGIDLWVSYERKITDRINWRIQANVRNVGKGDELIPISVQPDGQTWASVRIAPTQEWFVTNTFSF